jgi:hypothetical protein
MDSVSAEATQAWFAVKVAVALSPILIFLTADVIEWLPRALFGGARRWLLGSGPETARHEPAGSPLGEGRRRTIAHRLDAREPRQSRPAKTALALC